MNHLHKILVELAFIQIAAVDAILVVIDNMIQAETEASNWRGVFSYSIARTGMLELRQFFLENSVRVVEDRARFVQEQIE